MNNVLLIIFALCALLLSACAGRDPAQVARSAEEQFALQTDRVAEYTGRAMKANELLVDQKLIEPKHGTVLNDALLAVNSGNKELILAAQQFIVEQEGKRILRFTEDGRLQLEKIADRLTTATTNAINSSAFAFIDPKARSQLTALIKPAQLAATRLVNLIKSAKKITVTNQQIIEVELSYERPSDTNINFHRVRFAAI